ncbi:MAG: dihydrofolate reductase family protein, partial [Chloroflexota bacterium]
MAKLIYAAITSLDLYVADENGNFDWAEHDEEVHTLVNDLERPIGTQLYGRRMYDVLKVWESDEWMVGAPPHIKDYAAMWRAADKIVYSRSLHEVSTARTRIEREFDPEAVRRLKDSVEHDLGIGGPELAAEALRAGLVDEIHLFLNPIIVG